MSLNEFNKLYAPPAYVDDAGNLIENQDMQIVEWHRQEVEKSKNFLRSQRAWPSADNCMSILYGDSNEQVFYKNLSSINVKKLRRQAREAIANASNIRPRWQTQAKEEYAQTAEIYNKRRDAWFYSLFVDRYIKEALQWGGGAGTGYLMLWPEYNHKTCDYEIMPKVLSHKNVFPFHADADDRPDTVWGISCWFEMALPKAHEKWPEHMKIIKADRDVPSYFAGKPVNAGGKSWGSKLADWISDKRKKNAEYSPYPVADIFFTWVRDNSINTTGHELLLGEEGAAYAYKVPSYYDASGNRNKILDGRIVDSEDVENYNKARLITRKECMLFPNLRFMITTNNGVIYDGPPLWVCNRPPLEWFKFEEVPGEWLGIPIIRDGRNLERASNNMLRAIEDSVVGRIQPPIAVNSSLPENIIKHLSRSVRLMIGKVFKYNTMQMEKAIVPLLDADYFNIDARAVEMIKFLHEMQDYMAGTSDFAAWQRLKQLPAADTQESMIQNLGILATDHERTIERSILGIADIWQQFAPQVYTTDKMLKVLGKDGITEETWDFKASSLFPTNNSNDNRSLNQKLTDHMKIFSVHATPHSIQERMSITNKLTLMQLKKMGVPISDKKLYDTFVDDGQFGKNYEEYVREQKLKIHLAADLQRELQAANQAADPMNQMQQKLVEQIQGQSNNEGRPPNNTAPPRLEQKLDTDGVPRTTVATS